MTSRTDRWLRLEPQSEGTWRGGAMGGSWKNSPACLWRGLGIACGNLWTSPFVL
jgi:hypothetical protein